MAKKKRKSVWPKMNFLRTGPKLRTADLHAYQMHRTEDLDRFLLWRNGGVPQDDSFRMTYLDEDVVARVEYFNGMDVAGDDSVEDLITTIVNTWHELPRGCVPIGHVEIPGSEFDAPNLITFVYGERMGKIFFYSYPHDLGEQDPDDDEHLTLLANSLPQFVKSLQPHHALKFREVFQLKIDPESIPVLTEALNAAGVEEFWEFRKNSERVEYYYEDWEEFGCRISIGNRTREIGWVPLPKELERGACCLTVDVTKWGRNKAISQLKKVLKTCPAWKGAKYVGRTPAEPDRR